tara:strand:+ start:878 stop:1129 length:252 start_codon:yes stop_codon:yes gene_type:complete
MSQNLSPKAAAAKKKRDLAYANTHRRKRMRAFNQRWHRANPGCNGDYDHKDGRCKSVSANRGNDGKGTKREGKGFTIETMKRT